MSKIIEDIMENVQNDAEYLQQIIDELQDIKNNMKNDVEELKEKQLYIETIYDELLQKEENRGASYGEIAHIESLTDDELNALEEEILQGLEKYEV